MRFGAGMQLEPSRGYPPSARGLDALERTRAFLRETALPECAAFRGEHGDWTFALEPDGRPAPHVLAFKRRMQELSAAAGLYTLNVPEEDGGGGLGMLDLFYVHEEVFRHGLLGQQWMLAWTEGPTHLVRFLSDHARRSWLPDLMAGRINMASAITERGGGSDVSRPVTRARRDGDGWVLDGEKWMITGVPVVELVLVRVPVEGGPAGSLTCFVLPIDTPGVTRGPVLQTLLADGFTGSLRFDGVRLGPEHLIGREHGGVELLRFGRSWIRTRRAGMCSGLARHCLDRSLAFSQEREAFGRPIVEFGDVGAMLVDMYQEWTALRAVAVELLARFDETAVYDAPVSNADRRDLALLKTFCEDRLYAVADRAVQVHGGRGLLSEEGLEKIFRVARNLRIAGGTRETQRAAILATFLEDEDAVSEFGIT